MTRNPLPPPSPSWSDRGIRGFAWGLLYSGAYALANWLAWQAGCRTSRSGTPLEPADIVQAVAFFAIGVTDAATVVAIAKPVCRSWPRCSLVAFLALLLPMAALEWSVGPTQVS